MCTKGLSAKLQIVIDSADVLGLPIFGFLYHGPHVYVKAFDEVADTGISWHRQCKGSLPESVKKKEAQKGNDMLCTGAFTPALKDLVCLLACALCMDCKGRPSRCRGPGLPPRDRRRRCTRQ